MIEKMDMNTTKTLGSSERDEERNITNKHIISLTEREREDIELKKPKS